MPQPAWRNRAGDMRDQHEGSKKDGLVGGGGDCQTFLGRMAAFFEAYSDIKHLLQ